MRKCTVFIEKSEYGYSAYIGDTPLEFGCIGEGKTVEETIEDFLGTFEAMKQDFHGRRKPSRKTIHKIQSGVDRFAKELTAIKFA